MQEFVVSKLKSEKEIFSNSKIMDCFEMLENLNIPYEYVSCTRPFENNEELALIDAAIHVKGIKNLVFKTKKGNRYFLIILFRETQLDIKKFREEHNLPKITMANEEELLELLHCKMGSVSITELMYDKEKKIELFIEESILKEEYYRFHPNDNIATIRIRTTDLLTKLIPYLSHEINYI